MKTLPPKRVRSKMNKEHHIQKLLNEAERVKKFKETLHTVNRDLDPMIVERKKNHVNFLLKKYKK